MSNAKHTPGNFYPAGTRYSNSVVYDVATDERVFGFQVFEQFNEDGTPTGRKSFLGNEGWLCCLEIAESKRAEAIKEAAPDLLAALETCLHNSELRRASGVESGPVIEREIEVARAAIAKAKGEPK